MKKNKISIVQFSLQKSSRTSKYPIKSKIIKNNIRVQRDCIIKRSIMINYKVNNLIVKRREAITNSKFNSKIIGKINNKKMKIFICASRKNSQPAIINFKK